MKKKISHFTHKSKKQPSVVETTKSILKGAYQGKTDKEIYKEKYGI